MPQLPVFATDSSVALTNCPSNHAAHRLSRRAFLGGAVGTTGALLGASLLGPTAARAGPVGDDSPEPTTNTVVIGGVTFHLTSFGPGVDPSSITDFKGLVGVADVRGTGTATYPDGRSETLLFDTDMRFMSGTYIGRDNEVHHRSFGFIWLDLYRGRYDFTKFSTQVHDFDPGIHPYPGGLFWTVPLEAGEGEDHQDDDLRVDLDAGRARFAATNVPVRDFFNIPNALLHLQHPTSVAASCSFDIRWSGPVTSRMPVAAPKGSSGELLANQATMTWSANNANGLRFRSHPHPTTSAFAQLGRVRNGVFDH